MDLDIHYITNNQDLYKVQKTLLVSAQVGIDTETTGLDPIVEKIRLIQFATRQAVFVVDLNKVSHIAVKELLLEPLFTDASIVKIFHNAKFDLKFIQTNFEYGLREIVSLYDTYDMAKLCMGGVYYRAKLATLCEDYLNLELDKTNQLHDYSGSVGKDQVVYAALDAAVLLPLYDVINKSINANYLHRAALLELKCIPPIAQLELTGILLNKDIWIANAEQGKDELFALEGELRSALQPYIGDKAMELNLGSTKQLGAALSYVVGSPVSSTAKDAIAKLIDEYDGTGHDYRPLLAYVADYKKLLKQHNSFGLSFLEHIHPVTGRIHPNYKKTDTETFRFSCSQPNLQQIPNTPQVRSAFVAPEGKKLVCYDYSQIELRILAQFSGDPIFIHAFENDIDLHAATATKRFKVGLDAVTPEQRLFAKKINFGVPYGMGKNALARNLKVTPEEAAKELRAYYNQHPDLVAWFNGQKEYLRKYNCIRSVTGRIRDVSFWRQSSDREFEASQASRNFPIQSSSADILKTALVMAWEELPHDWLLVNQVHDEVIYEVPDLDAAEAAQSIARIMVAAAEEYLPDVPVKVDGEVGTHWRH